MLIIILGILILVHCSKYKKHPLQSTLSTLKTITIVHTVLFCFSSISLISSVITLATGSFFETFEEMFLAFFRAADIDTIHIAGILGNINNFIQIAMWTSIIMDVAIFVFGLIALINGVKTLSDRNLEATATTNTAEENQRRQAMFAQNMRNYQQNQQNYGYNQQGYGYNQQNYGYNQQNAGYQNYNQQTTTSFTTQQPQNTAWVCSSCGSSNIPAANFCNHCGQKH